jgi:hypothetical protein
MTIERKTSITDRINYFQQQTENQRQVDLITHQQQQLQELERQKQEETKRQQEVRERIRKTKENFAGTGILETFQEIIDKQILVFASFTQTTWEKGFFREKQKYSNIIIPAKIQFYFNKLELIHSVSHYSSSSEFLGCPSGYEYHKISIEKKEDGYELSTDDLNESPVKGDFNTVTDEIAKLITTKHWYSGSFNYRDGQEDLINYSKTFDESIIEQ